MEWTFIVALLAARRLQGTLIGQLLFGMIADQLGRKLMFVTTMALVIVGSLGSALLSWNVWIISVFFCLGNAPRRSTKLSRTRARFLLLSSV
jgi:MFS family permease